MCFSLPKMDMALPLIHFLEREKNQYPNYNTSIYKFILEYVYIEFSDNYKLLKIFICEDFKPFFS